jgi:small subunit ribosomal protein S20
MANTAQAKKRARQGEVRRVRNVALRTKLRTFIKKVVAAIESGDKTVAQSAYKEAQPIIDKMAGKGIIHKNKAARHKSRLSAHIKSMPQA